MLGIANKGFAANMNVVRMNQRNCGGTDGLAPALCHSGLSTDGAAVARELLERERMSRVALVGCSMGGNLVLKLAGEWGKEAPSQLRAVVTVCPAVDLAASSDAVHIRSNRVHEDYFLWHLRRRLRATARLFPHYFHISPFRRPTSPLHSDHN